MAVLNLRATLPMFLKSLKKSFIAFPVFSLISSLLTVPSALAGEIPTSFSATYTVKKGIVVLGETKRTLKPAANGNFTFESITNPSAIAKMISDGTVIERSTWAHGDTNLKPQIYIYKNTGGKKVREVKLLFDWDDKTITNIINGDPWKMELTEGVQDKLLYQLSLMYDLNKGKKDLQYDVADGGRIKHYKAEILGKEMIETDVGTFETVIVSRKTDSRITTFWCAPELGYLPVLIEQKKTSGGRLEARLSELSGFGNRNSNDSDF